MADWGFVAEEPPAVVAKKAQGTTSQAAENSV